MPNYSHQDARDRVQSMANDARYRPFIVGYLLSCLDERHWEALANAAIEFAENNIARQEESLKRVEGIPSKRG